VAKSSARPAAKRSAKTGSTSASKSRRGPSRKEIEKRSVPRRAAGQPTEVAASGADLSDRVKDVARTRALQESKTVAEQAIEAALEKKALLPVLLDVSGRATYTDFIGIVSGRSDRQVDAIAEHVVTTLKQRGSQLLSREGNGNGRWTLLDFGDIVVHVFYHPVREFYDIESLWIDAPRVKLKVPPEATQLREEALFYERP
jgi:ribosome-associated protein